MTEYRFLHDTLKTNFMIVFENDHSQDYPSFFSSGSKVQRGGEQTQAGKL